MARADYEGRILRSVLLYPEATLYTLLHSLQSKHFNDPQYRKAFNVIKELATKQDALSSDKLMDALEEHGISSEMILNSWGNTYNGVSIQEPIQKIKTRTLLTQLDHDYHNWQQDVKKADTDVATHITQVMSRLYDLQGDTALQSSAPIAIDKMFAQRERYIGNQYYGVQTGIEKLDFLTMGMQPQRLWLVGGYTSIGKSWVGVQAVKQHLAAGIPTLWLSYEMAAEELMWRLCTSITDRSDITLNKVKNKIDLNEEQEAAFLETAKKVRGAPLYVIDNLSTWEESRMAILYHIYAHKVKCVVVDYVQNIILEKAASEYESLNRIIRDCQRIAVERDAFVMAFSQINRESARNNNERVFGYKGSGNLENAADVAITIRKLDDEKRRLVVVGKNRNGATGEVMCYVNFEYGWITEDKQYVYK